MWRVSALFCQQVRTFFCLSSLIEPYMVEGSQAACSQAALIIFMTKDAFTEMLMETVTCVGSDGSSCCLLWESLFQAWRSWSGRVSDFWSVDSGSDPLAGQGKRQFFCPFESTRLLRRFLCACLPLPPSPPPSSCIWLAPKICAHMKDPVSVCCKGVGLTAAIHKCCTRWVKPVNVKYGEWWCYTRGHWFDTLWCLEAGWWMSSFRTLLSPRACHARGACWGSLSALKSWRIRCRKRRTKGVIASRSACRGIGLSQWLCCVLEWLKPEDDSKEWVQWFFFQLNVFCT